MSDFSSAFWDGYARAEREYLEPTDPPEPMFDSLAACAIERCGKGFDCDDCVEKTCLCEDWQEEMNDLTADDYAIKDDE